VQSNKQLGKALKRGRGKKPREEALATRNVESVTGFLPAN